jgi:hypothetical protein
VGFFGFFDGKIDHTGIEAVFSGKGFDVGRFEEPLASVLHKNIFPEFNPLAAVERLEMKTESESAQNRILDAGDAVGDPYNSDPGCFQKLVQPALILGFSPAEPGVLRIQNIIGLIHDNERAVTGVGQIQAGQNGRSSITGGVFISPNDLIGGDVQMLFEAVSKAGLPGSGRSV